MFYIQNEYPTYFLFTKEVDWKHARTEWSQLESFNVTVTTCGILNNRMSGKTCVTYNAGNVWYHRWFTAQIKRNHCGYWICRKRNEARLALGQAQHVTCHNWISSLVFPQKYWSKTLNLQQLNGLISNMASLWIVNNGIPSDKLFANNVIIIIMHNTAQVFVTGQGCILCKHCWFSQRQVHRAVWA